MTAFAINSGGIVEWDSLSGGSTGSALDTYTISAGSTLLIDCDTHHCLNHSTAFGSLDTVGFADIGGELLVDGTAVRVIPYDTGTGNVPAIGTSISQGGVSAELLGVWDNWQSEPTAAGDPMPANGWIKVKGKSGGDFAAGALTSIGANATGADVVGWIEVRLADTGLMTTPRRGSFRVEGALFELGTTSGSRGQVLECPTTATNAGVFPGVLIETAVGSGLFEWYASVGTLAADSAIGTEAARGKVIWQTTSGIRIGSDGTNNVGYLPASGLRVVIPNVIFTCCTRSGSGSGPRVVPNATLATRWEFANNQGSVNVEKAVFQAYFNVDLASEINLTDFAANDVCRITNPFSEVHCTRVCVAPTQVQTGNIALTLSGCLDGGELEDCVFWRSTLPSTNQVVSILQCQNIHFTRGLWGTLGFRASGNSYVLALGDGSLNITADDLTFVGGKLTAASARLVTFNNTKFVDRFQGSTNSTQGQQIFELSNVDNFTMDGLEYPVSGCEAYFAIIRMAKTCNNLRARNVGSYASPLNLNSNTEKVIEFNGYGDNIKIQRIFLSNLRGRAWTDNGNSARYTNVQIDNVFADYASDGRPFANMQQRGCRKSTATNQIGSPGQHFLDEYTSATAGIIQLRFNAPTDATTAFVTKTAGDPLYGSSDVTFFPTTGDQLVCEMQYFALGYTATANVAPTIAGASTGNLDLEFDVDLGSGFSGSYTALTQANWFAVGAIDPTVGIKVRIRVTANASNNATSIYRLDLPLTTTTTAHQNYYPLDVNTVSVTGLATGTRVKLIRNDTNAILASGIEVAGAVSFDVDYSGDVTVFARKASGSPYYKEWTAVGTLTADGLDFVAQQVLDE